MIDMEKVIKEYEDYVNSYISLTTSHDYEFEMHKAVLTMLKEQEAEISKISNAYLDLVGKASKQPEIVRCKECKHRGNSEKCVLTAISEEKDFPLFMLDNRGEWFCADGARKDS